MRTRPHLGKLLVRLASTEVVTILAITAAAFAIRVYRLDSVPPGLYWDEATNGLDALDVLAGHMPVFFTRTFGREPLFIYLQAVAISLVGQHAFALRLTAAVVGSATVTATYWMISEIAVESQNRRRMAAWTAIFVAISYWHVSLSRIGFRAICTPLFACVALAMFWRGWHQLAGGRRPIGAFAACGAFVGISLYTYIAARFIPFLILCTLGLAAWSTRPRVPLRRITGALAVISSTAVIVFAPLGLYFLRHPDEFIFRSSVISVFNTSLNDGNVLSDFLRSVGMTIGMFGISGDPNLRHNPAALPAVEWWIALFIMVGTAVGLRRREILVKFAAIWCAVMALPAVLTTSTAGMPSHLRTLGMVPAVYLLTVQGMDSAVERLPCSWRRPATVLIPFAMALATLGGTLPKYFQAFEAVSTLAVSYFDQDYVLASEFLSAHGQHDTTWIVPSSMLYSRPSDAEQPTIAYLYDGPGYIEFVLDSEVHAPEMLRSATQSAGRARLVTWAEGLLPAGAFGMADRRDLLGFLLARYTLPEENPVDLGPLTYRSYRVVGTPSYKLAGDLTAEDIVFGDMVKLVGSAYGPTVARGDETDDELNGHTVSSGESVWVQLHWQAVTDVATDLKATVVLTDAAGHVVGQSDDPLVSVRYPYKVAWEAGEDTISYHILPTIPGLPPGTYNLNVGVYVPESMRRLHTVVKGGASPLWALLGAVQVTSQINAPLLAPTVTMEANLGPLQLFGIDPPGTLIPGTAQTAALYWKAVEKPTQDYRLDVAIQGPDGSIYPQPVASWLQEYPTSQWLVGESLREVRDLVLPPEASSGSYSLLLEVTSEAGSERLDLGTLHVVSRSHSFETPAPENSIGAQFEDGIDLIGYTIDQELLAQGNITVTLYWHAGSTPHRSYTTFVHLLAPDGRFLAGYDSPPLDGEAPTTTWLPGEFITDKIVVPLPQSAPLDNCVVEVGLYDSETLIRLTLVTGNVPPADRVLLPERISLIQ